MKAPNPDLVDHLPSAYRNGVYREESAEASSSSDQPGPSRYRDEELPAYEETPLLADSPDKSKPKPQPEVRRRWYQPPPDLPFSRHDHNPRNVDTYFPDYSTDAETLRQMIYEQASYPPTYYIEIGGTHTETTYRNSGNRNSREQRESDTTTSTITDFLIRINITHLLSSGPDVGGELHLLEDGKKGYRGGIIKRKTPTVGSPEIETQHEELKAWCDKFIADPSMLKSFTLQRKVINHDTTKLATLIRSVIASTNYRGLVSVSFPVTHQRVTVYSPSRINQWRMTTWIRWIFYLTFLWIFSWLFLFLATARYEVVKVVFPYADVLDGEARTPTVMSETAWFNLWERAIRRSVLGRMNCGKGEIDDEYRLTTDNIATRDDLAFDSYRSGNSYPGGVVGLFGTGGQFRGQWQERESWGCDEIL
ncbi:hypothetical protein GLAREA_05030 [Glarea lozoyensis ATCC 20868]|uniref:Uncharacterized protein n=1 Tax=Glarea lozoyensis (strain ATCC 20868 / MF5171) TaxID=1116229 RepID=S3EBL1_GLAL2|nr:uncharacterized protein GLAREA_05030 [Glarea lozoyensis ATCC 20868]EPE35693.1 hypothetical protein GLAREA_05030 [Glarea lozoyensis ATCC 20868]